MKTKLMKAMTSVRSSTISIPTIGEALTFAVVMKNESKTFVDSWYEVPAQETEKLELICVYYPSIDSNQSTNLSRKVSARWQINKHTISQQRMHNQTNK